MHAFLVGTTVTLIILLDTGAPLLWSGAVILVMGLFIFIRFLVQNPIRDDSRASGVV